jgi:polyisoprenoid-binding protein YceI
MTTTTATDLATATGTWAIDVSHSNVSFVARHAVITKVRGKFTDFVGNLVLDGTNPSNSKIEVTIQAASFDSASADRDAHVKSADFLDVENFPTLTFTSTGLRNTGGSDYVVDGDLTIHGVTKPVSIEAEFSGIATDPWGNTKIGFEGKAEISRKDFGLTWNVALEAGGVLVSDKIQIVLDVQAAKQA